MLSPPVPPHGSYSPITGFAEWGGNYKITKELAGELGIRVPMDRTKSRWRLSSAFLVPAEVACENIRQELR